MSSRKEKGPHGTWNTGGPNFLDITPTPIAEQKGYRSMEYSQNTKSRQDTRRHRSKRTSKFAKEVAAEEFGYQRHFAWRQWGDFSDTTPAELAKRRRK